MLLAFTLGLSHIIAAVNVTSRPYMTAPDLMASLQEVHIMSPTPFTGDWAAGYVFRVAAEIATDIINSEQRILPGLKLVSTWFDDQGNSEYAVKHVVENLLKPNASWIGVGGTGNSDVCGWMGLLLPEFRKPQVCYGLSSVSLADPIKYPSMVRMGTVESGMVEVLEVLVRTYKWTDISIFQGSIARFAALETLFLDHFAGQLNLTVVQPREPSFEELYHAMVKLRKARQRVIVLLGYQEFLLSCLCAADRAGMPDGVVWLSMGTFLSGVSNLEFIQTEILSSYTLKRQECDAAGIVRRAEGFLFVGYIGAPAPQHMDDPLDCLQSFTSRSFRDVLVNHFEIGYPVGENKAPNWWRFRNAIANGADGMCVWAYLVRHMIEKGYTLENLEKPDRAIHSEMMRFMLKDLHFRGAMGIIDFDGTDLPGHFGLYQIQNGSFNSSDVLAVVADGTIAPVRNRQLMWGDGSTSPGTFFPACPFNSLYVNGSCKECAMGTYFDDKKLECIACDKGQFSDQSGALNCSLCAPGSAQFREGSTHCTPCPSGKFYADSGAHRCRTCMPGRYTQRAGSAQCDACGRGVSCLGGSEPPVSTEGYYLVSFASVQQCIVETETSTGRRSACLGNQPFMSQELSCAVGHTGPLCGACAPHYARANVAEECQACTIENSADVVQAILLLNANLVWNAAVAFVSGIFLLQSLRDHSDLDPVLLRILIHWMSVCSVLIDWKNFQSEEEVEFFELGSNDTSYFSPTKTATVFPSWFEEVPNFVFWGSGLLEIGAPELNLGCLADYLDVPTHDKINLMFAWWLVYPLMVGMWLLVMMFIQQALVKLRKGAIPESAQDRTLPIFLISLYFSWDLLTAKALPAMACAELKSGEEGSRTIQPVWLGDPRESCFDVARNAVAITALIIWSFGFPCMVYILIKRHSDNLKEKRTNRLFGFFYKGLEERCWWWEILVKRFDLFAVLVITHTSLVSDSTSKLVMYTLIAGSAWGIHAQLGPFIDINNNLLDDIEQFSLFSRFFMMASLVSVVFFQIPICRILALVSCMMAFCTCIIFFMRVLLYIFMTKSSKIAFKLEIFNLKLNKRFGESPQGARNLILHFVERLVFIFSYADVSRHRLQDSALHIQWPGPGLPLKIAKGQFPDSGFNFLRQLIDQVIWRAYGLENDEQMNYCFGMLQTIQQLVVAAQGDIPTQPTVGLLTLAMKEARFAAGLQGNALVRAQASTDQQAADFPRTSSGIPRLSTLQQISVENVLDIAKEIMNEYGGRGSWKVMHAFSGDDLYALLVMLESLTKEATLEMFESAVDIMDMDEEYTPNSMRGSRKTTGTRGCRADRSLVTTSSLEEMQRNTSTVISSVLSEADQAIPIDVSPDPPVLIKAREQNHTPRNHIAKVDAPDSYSDALSMEAGLNTGADLQGNDENPAIMMNLSPDRPVLIEARKDSHAPNNDIDAVTAPESCDDALSMDEECKFSADLQGLKLKALKDIAQQEGVSDDQIEQIDDTNDPAESLKVCIISVRKAKAKYILGADLQGLKLKALKTRAAEEGVTNEQIQDVDDTADPLQSMKDCIIHARKTKVQQPWPVQSSNGTLPISDTAKEEARLDELQEAHERLLALYVFEDEYVASSSCRITTSGSPGHPSGAYSEVDGSMIATGSTRQSSGADANFGGISTPVMTPSLPVAPPNTQAAFIPKSPISEILHLENKVREAQVDKVISFSEEAIEQVVAAAPPRFTPSHADLIQSLRNSEAPALSFPGAQGGLKASLDWFTDHWNKKYR